MKYHRRHNNDHVNLFQRHFSRTFSAVLSVLAGFVFLASSACAADRLPGLVAPLDDSMSIIHGGPAKLVWDSDRSSKPASNAVTASTRATLVLDTSAYAGSRVLIHQTMSSVSSGWSARWRVASPFIDGVSRTGQRVLLFQGLLAPASRRLQIDIAYEFSIDASQASDFQNLSFSYDIEVI